MSDLRDILIPISICCVMPIVMVWLEVRKKMNETNQRTQILLAAIEKNPDMDLEDLMNKMTPKKQLLKEKLLSKLLWGCLTAFLGLGLIGFAIYLHVTGQGGTSDSTISTCCGLVLLGIGIAFLVNYFIGKKMLAKEMEAEQNKLLEQA